MTPLTRCISRRATLSRRSTRCDAAAAASPHGCASCAGGASSASRRSASRRRATRSGGSPTSRRSPTRHFAPATTAHAPSATSIGWRLAGAPAAPSWCSSTAAIVAELSRRRRCRRRRGVAAWRHARDEPATRRAASRAASRRSIGTPFIGAEHRVPRRRRVRARSRRTRSSSSRSICCSSRRRRRRAERVASARADRRWRAAARRTIVETYVGPPATRTSPTPSPRSSSATSAVVDHYKVQRESRAAFHVGSHAGARRARARRSRRTRSALGGALVRNDVDAVLDGEGADCTLNGLYLGRRHAAHRQPHDDRPRQAALHQPRALQGHPRRPARAASSTARSSSGQTRRRPTPSRPTRPCCSPTTRRSTPSRSSRSSPTT